MLRRGAYLPVSLLVAILAAWLLAACRPAPAPPPTAALTATPLPTETPTPTPTATPIPGLITGDQVSEVLETAFYLTTPKDFEENNDSRKDNDVYRAEYYCPLSNVLSLAPVAEHEVALYSPQGPVDLSQYFGEKPELVELKYKTEKGEGVVFVPEEAVKGILGEQYLSSLSLPEGKEMTLFATMPSQILEMVDGMKGVVYQEGGVPFTISESTNGRGLAMGKSLSGEPIFLVGTYDATPDNDPSDDKVIAIQTPESGQLSSLSNREERFSDVQLISREDIGVSPEVIASLPDLTSDYQKLKGFWYGEYVQGLVDAENLRGIHLIQTLPMATERVENGGSLQKQTGWLEELVVLRDTHRREIDNMIEVRLNYGRDSQGNPISLTFPLASRNWHSVKYVAKEGSTFDLALQPASLGYFARGVLEGDPVYTSDVGRIVALDLLASRHPDDITKPGVSRNRTFDYMLWAGMRELLGQHKPDEVMLYYPDENGNIPGEEFNGYRLFYSGSSGSAKEIEIVSHDMALRNATGRLVVYENAYRYKNQPFNADGAVKMLRFGRGSSGNSGPNDPQFGVPIEYLERMGVTFMPVQNYSPEIFNVGGPVLLDVAVQNRLKREYPRNKMVDNVEEFAENAQAWVPDSYTLEIGGKEMKVGELVVDMVEHLPPGSMVAFNQLGYSPLLAFMDKYIAEEDRDIGFGGHVIGEYKTTNDRVDKIYQGLYKSLLEGRIPQPFVRMYYDRHGGFSFTLYPKSGFFFNEMPDERFKITSYREAFSGRFGKSERIFSAEAFGSSRFSHDLGFIVYLTPKSNYLAPPWMMKGFFSNYDTIDEYYHHPPKVYTWFSGFQPYEPQK